MNKKEFLQKLLAETSNAKLVAQYDEFIEDRLAEGESEEVVIASYNIKQIARMNELEQRELSSATAATTATVSATKSDNNNNNQKVALANNHIFCLILMLVGFALAIVCAGLSGYFVSELAEVLGGHYDHMGEAYVRSELIGYSLSLAFCALALIGGIIVGVIFAKRFKRLKI